MENVELRKVLIYLFHKYKGDKEQINKNLYDNNIDERIINAFYKKASYKFEFLTILDDDYPQRLKGMINAPYVIPIKKGQMVQNYTQAQC